MTGDFSNPDMWEMHEQDYFEILAYEAEQNQIEDAA